MSELANLGVGGIFCVLVLREVFSFLKAREAKRSKESLNGNSPEHLSMEAVVTIAKQCEIQTTLLRELRDDQRRQTQATGDNGRSLGRIEDKLDLLRMN
jgi:hypothetical protein